MIDISVDLETLATGPNASIVQIGAVHNGPCFPGGDEFFRNVHDPTGDISVETVRWHVEQAKAHPEVDVVGTDVTVLPVATVLQSFTQWLRMVDAHRDGAVAIWGHAGFDLTILASAYRRVLDQPPPWHYRNQRDLRTLYDLAGGRPDVPHAGKHNALADAAAQLEEVRICRERLEQWSKLL